MINIKYDNGEIKVTTEKISLLYDIPLKLKITSQIGGDEIWSCDLFDDYWASFPNNELNDVKILDKNNELVLERKWNVLEDGNTLYKTLYFYCQKFIKNNIRPFGVAVGTHDGKFGEWVPSVIDNLTDAILCEPTKKQYEKLYKYYGSLPNVITKNDLITTDGKSTVFYEGGLGYTNSVIKNVIDKWEKEEISSNIIDSLSINKLFYKKLDWLHTDVEGYDAKLIMGMNQNLLPNLIIFEHENISKDENENLKNYLEKFGFKLFYYSVSCLAIRDNLN